MTRRYDRGRITRLLLDGNPPAAVARAMGCSERTVGAVSQELRERTGWGRFRWDDARDKALLDLVEAVARRWGTTPRTVASHAYYLTHGKGRNDG